MIVLVREYCTENAWHVCILTRSGRQLRWIVVNSRTYFVLAAAFIVDGTMWPRLACRSLTGMNTGYVDLHFIVLSAMLGLKPVENSRHYMKILLDFENLNTCILWLRYNPCVVKTVLYFCNKSKISLPFFAFGDTGVYRSFGCVTSHSIKPMLSLHKASNMFTPV